MWRHDRPTIAKRLDTGYRNGIARYRSDARAHDRCNDRDDGDTSANGAGAVIGGTDGEERRITEARR